MNISNFLLYLLASLILFVLPTTFVQAENVDRIDVTGIAADQKGNIYICGMFDGFAVFGRHKLQSNKGSTDIFLAKYRTDGTCIWAVRAGGDGTDVPKSIVVDQKGNVLIAGNFTSEADFGVIKVDSKGSSDVFVARYNTSGSANWVVSFGGKGDDEMVQLTKDESGSI